MGLGYSFAHCEVSLSQAARPQSETIVAEMFDRIAGRYDLLNHLLSLNIDKLWRKHLVNALPVRRDMEILDVATGTCDVMLAIENQRGSTVRKMTGVDISAGMLEHGRRKLAAAGLAAKSTLQVMSASRLEFPAHTFDGITIAFGLRNVVEKEKALSEFRRCLKPAGVVGVLEFFQPDNTIMAKGFMFYFNRILPAIGSALSDRVAYTYLPRSVEGFYSAPELKKKMAETGFSDIREQRFLFGACRLITAKA